jgi:hypothetical protein
MEGVVIFCGHLVYIFYVHLVDFVVIGYIVPCFGMLYREKSGNPAGKVCGDRLKWHVKC